MFEIIDLPVILGGKETGKTVKVAKPKKAQSLRLLKKLQFMAYYEDMTDEDLANLTLLNHDEIDYRALSDKILKKLVLGNELYIAASALSELKLRNSKIGPDVSGEILAASHGDHYLQAAALAFLFETNREQALNYMFGHVQQCHPLILNEMMALIFESDFDFRSKAALTLAPLIGERLKGLDNEDQEFIDQDVKYKVMGILSELRKSAAHP